MIRLLLVLFLAGSTAALAQQGPAPIVETVPDQDQVIPGQSMTLRVNVLVPTWMPSPPEMPGFETPNLRVRQPSRGTTAISHQIAGQNWSGISRRYLLTPMIPGEFHLPAQDIRVTYIGPDGRTPITATVLTQPVTLTGTLPHGAEGLDPFVAANSLTLTQELSGPTTGLAPGASVTRTLTATIEGTSPIVLPKLMTALDLAAIRTYPDSPQVNERDDGDSISGTRIETETLMAVGGGEGRVAPVRVEWFNLRTGKVETAEAEGFEIAVNGPPPRIAGQSRDWHRILPLLAGVLGGVMILIGGVPHLRAWVEARRSARLVTEAHARHMLLAAISHRDYADTTRWMAIWQDRLPRASVPAPAQLSDAFARVGALRFGSGHTGGDSAWRDLDTLVRGVGNGPHAAITRDLPLLNPGHSC